MSDCEHDDRFGGVFFLPKEDRGCLACGYERLQKEKAMDEIVSEEVLRDAKDELRSTGSDHVQRLAKTICILLEGIIDRALEDYEPEVEQR